MYGTRLHKWKHLNYKRVFLRTKSYCRPAPLTLGVEDAYHLLAETALRLGRGSLHVQHDRVALNLQAT